MPPQKKLHNLAIATFEVRHGKTLADLLLLHGAIPIAAPALKEVPLEKNPAAFEFGERLLKNEIDRIIFLTGVGTRALMDILKTRHTENEVLQALRRTTVVPRGPKPIRVLNEWKVPYAFIVPEPNTWRELMAELDARKDVIPLKGRTVAVQEYGAPNPELTQALEARGARVLSVPVYRWELPDDVTPLESVIDRFLSGSLHAAIFTTSVQAEHLFQVAERLGVVRRLRDALKDVVIASVGPDCSRTLRALGVEVDLEPQSPKMGPLVQLAADRIPAVLEKKRNGCAVSVREAVLAVAANDAWNESPFMKACRREPVPFTPIWLLRQAGRYMKEYRDIRAKTPFIELCRNKELVAEVAVSAQRALGADAAILFSDILLLLDSFGMGLSYLSGDGPSVERPIRTAADVKNLPDLAAEHGLSAVLDGVRLTRRKLDARIPLIGFAGAPFTMASYMIEGGASKDFTRTKALMRSDAAAWDLLMEKIVRVTSAYLKDQAASGAQVLQLFDSWVGCLETGEYERFVLPHSKALIASLGGIPVIHFGTGTSALLPLMARAGGNVIGVDHRVPILEAWTKIGHQKVIQGNLDPALLCEPREKWESAAQKILDDIAGRPGHIFNLGHGVLPETPPENAVALVEFVHRASRRP